MITQNVSTENAGPQPNGAVFGAITLLVGAYLTLSVLTFAAIAFLSWYEPDLVNAQAWVRGGIVAVTSVWLFVLSRLASKGVPRALLRLRIVVVSILVFFVVVLFFLALPSWMLIEQAVCGVLLLVAAFLAFRGRELAG